MARERILGQPSPPYETGDLAYRATFTMRQLLELRGPEIDALCRRKVMTLWMGPDKHCVFYPIRGGNQFNLVLLRPDNLPTNVQRMQGDLHEMRLAFEGWNDTYAAESKPYDKSGN